MMHERSQSALHAAQGSPAELIDELGTALYIVAALIFAVVMALAVYGVFGRERAIDTRRWIIGGGLVLPIVTLTALLVYSIAVSNALASIGTSRALQLFLDCFGIGTAAGDERAGRAFGRSDRIRVHVSGKQWWWEVKYELPGGDTSVVLANELRIPVGRPVEILLSTTDVIHSFWVPALAGKVDMIPGRTTRLLVQTEQARTFRGQCAEYCGAQHALMAFFVIAEPLGQFEAWLARQAQPASVPTDPFLKLGYDAFFKGDCQRCHAIRGTPATSSIGPDLTHVGGRHSLAAGTIDNHIGTMAGWIAGAQDVKPGNRMPSMVVYTGHELRAVSAWLASLE